MKTSPILTNQASQHSIRLPRSIVTPQAFCSLLTLHPLYSFLQEKQDRQTEAGHPQGNPQRRPEASSSAAASLVQISVRANGKLIAAFLFPEFAGFAVVEIHRESDAARSDDQVSAPPAQEEKDPQH